MYIIAGLGNPGAQYAGTRHNVGFACIDELADQYNISVDTSKHKGLIGKGVIEGQKVILVKPKVIVLLGSTALKNVLGKEYSITASRGKWIEQKGIMYMPTWHPAALLRDENKKIEFWKDLKVVVNFFNKSGVEDEK